MARLALGGSPPLGRALRALQVTLVGVLASPDLRADAFLALVLHLRVCRRLGDQPVRCDVHRRARRHHGAETRRAHA
eukprot:9278218-Pyramimonas_sp.AAC.1